jgi:WD40 repeat protein
MEMKKKKNSDIKRGNNGIWIFLGWLVFSLLWLWSINRLCPLPGFGAANGEIVSYREHFASNGINPLRNPFYVFMAANVIAIIFLIRLEKRLLFLLLIPFNVAACYMSLAFWLDCGGKALEHLGTQRFEGKTYHLAYAYSMYFDDALRHDLYLYECANERDECYQHYVEDNYSSGFSGTSLGVVNNQLQISNRRGEITYRLDARIKDFSLPQLEPITQTNVERIQSLGDIYYDYVEDMAWLQGATTLAVSGDNGIWFHEFTGESVNTRHVNYGSELRMTSSGYRPSATDSYYTSLALSPDSQYVGITAYVYNGSSPSTVIYDADNFTEVFTIPNGGNNVEYSPDGRYFVTKSGLGMGLFDAQYFEELGVFAPLYDIRELVFSPDSQYLATFSGSGKVIVWDVETQEHIFTYQMPGDSYYSGQKVAFSPDSDFLAISVQDSISLSEEDEPHYIRIFDFQEQAEIVTINLTRDDREGAYIGAIIWSDEMLITSNRRGLWFWNSETGGLISMSVSPIPSYDQYGAMGRLTLSTDGTLLAAAIGDGGVRFWGVPKSE